MKKKPRGKPLQLSTTVARQHDVFALSVPVSRDSRTSRKHTRSRSTPRLGKQRNRDGVVRSRNSQKRPVETGAGLWTRAESCEKEAKPDENRLSFCYLYDYMTLTVNGCPLELIIIYKCTEWNSNFKFECSWCRN